MRYPNCAKIEAFKLFDQGKRPSEIYDLVTVKKHTLFAYYQQWKKECEEQEKENKRTRLASERQEALKRQRMQRKREAQERESMLLSLRVQQRIQMGTAYNNQKKRVLELEAQMSRAADKPNNLDEIQRIGELYSQAYDRFRKLTRQLYPRYADEKSIEMVLHPRRE